MALDPVEGTIPGNASSVMRRAGLRAESRGFSSLPPQVSPAAGAPGPFSVPPATEIGPMSHAEDAAPAIRNRSAIRAVRCRQGPGAAAFMPTATPMAPGSAAPTLADRRALERRGRSDASDLTARAMCRIHSCRETLSC